MRPSRVTSVFIELDLLYVQTGKTRSFGVCLPFKMDYGLTYVVGIHFCACDCAHLLVEVASHFSQAILTKYLPTSPSGVLNERCSFLCVIGKNMCNIRN